MNAVFADTSYWIALIFPHDTHHAIAITLAKRLVGEHRRVVTSQMVITEFLNFFALFGPHWRDTTVNFVRYILADPNTTVIEQTNDLFIKAVDLYSRRRDKEWGHTDCASFVIMTELGIAEALTHDRHFQQAGFAALMRED